MFFISTRFGFKSTQNQLLIISIFSIMPHKFKICKFDTIRICIITSKVLRGNFPRSTLCYNHYFRHFIVNTIFCPLWVIIFIDDRYVCAHSKRINSILIRYLQLCINIVIWKGSVTSPDEAACVDSGRMVTNIASTSISQTLLIIVNHKLLRAAVRLRRKLQMRMQHRTLDQIKI